MFAKLAFTIALLASSTAWVQDSEPTAEQIAETRARVDTLIKSNSADAFFVNKSRGEVAMAEHVGSGMLCFFTGSSIDRITIYPVRSDGVLPGQDVGCATRFNSGEISTYATDYAGSPTIDENMQGALDAIRGRWPDIVPYDYNFDQPERPIADSTQAAAFRVTVEGREMVTVLMVWDHKEWSYKLRATGAFEHAEDLLGLSTALMARIQRDVLEP